MDRKGFIERWQKEERPKSGLAMRLFILAPTQAFEGKEEIGFDIIEKVAEFFSVSPRAVHSCGSAKLGFSPIKGTAFVEGSSDFDIAIIDSGCFNRYVGKVIKATNQYKDLTGFSRPEGGSPAYSGFAKYLAKGIFRPDMMPKSDAKKEVDAFFRELTALHREIFGNISAAIYMSDEAFQMRQSEALGAFGTGASL